MADDYEKQLTSFLRKHNISTYSFTHRSKHRALTVEHKGETVTLIFPSTSVYRRGPYESVTTLRRLLNLARPPRATHAPKRKLRRRPPKRVKRVKAIAAAPAAPSLTNDYVAVLRGIQSAMLASNENAAAPAAVHQ